MFQVEVSFFVFCKQLVNNRFFFCRLDEGEICNFEKDSLY
jgi:hypothetical protein